MQKISQLKTNSDTLKTKFDEDMEIFGKNFLTGHTLKKLPNLNLNQIQNLDYDLNSSFIGILDDPEPYELNSVLTRADNEVDLYLRQLDNKKKTFFLQQKLINLHKLTMNERYSLIFACIFLFLIGASLGAIIRKGGLGLPLVLSIVIFLTYHYIGVFGKNAAEDNSLSPFIGSWISTFIIAPFAIYLTKIVSMDRGFNFSFFDRLYLIFKNIRSNNEQN
jgi:lipopolysaccharide export system permease protein